MIHSRVFEISSSCYTRITNRTRDADRDRELRSNDRYDEPARVSPFRTFHVFTPFCVLLSCLIRLGLRTKAIGVSWLDLHTRRVVYCWSAGATSGYATYTPSFHLAICDPGAEDGLTEASFANDLLHAIPIHASSSSARERHSHPGRAREVKKRPNTKIHNGSHKQRHQRSPASASPSQAQVLLSRVLNDTYSVDLRKVLFVRLPLQVRMLLGAPPKGSASPGGATREQPPGGNAESI